MSRKVHVYRNLHTGCFSVRDAETGRVAGDNLRKTVVLRGVTFHVSESGRQRVLREQRKNVHATVRGQLHTLGDELPPGCATSPGVPVGYNPFAGPHFVCKTTGVPLRGADVVVLHIDSNGHASMEAYGEIVQASGAIGIAV